MNMIRSAKLHFLMFVGLLCIQVPTYATYSYGDPCALEQEHLEYINRARANPAAEAGRTDITSINEGPPSTTLTDTPKQPLAFNNQLFSSALGHTTDMLQRSYFEHLTKDTDDNPFDRIRNANYGFTQAAENIAFSRNSTDIAWRLHYMLFKDAGVDGRGHRVSILNGAYKEVGIGLRSLNGMWKVTANFGLSKNDAQKQAFVLGVVYYDSNDNDFYNAGEGVSNVSVTISNGSLTTTASAGGYAVPNLTNGDYTITFSHSEYGSVSKNFTVANDSNIKVDATLNEFSHFGNFSVNLDSFSTCPSPTVPTESDNETSNSPEQPNNVPSNPEPDNVPSNPEQPDNVPSNPEPSNSTPPSADKQSNNQSSTQSVFMPPPKSDYSLLNISSSHVHVISQPVGIDCNKGEGQCHYLFKWGTTVELFFVEELPEYLFFDGWFGDADCEDGKIRMNKTISCATRVYGRPGFDIPTTSDDTITSSNSTIEISDNTTTGSNSTTENSDSIANVTDSTSNVDVDNAEEISRVIDNHVIYTSLLAPYTQLKVINSNSYAEILGMENDLITGLVLQGTGQQTLMLRAQPHTLGAMPAMILQQLHVQQGQWIGRKIAQIDGVKAMNQTLTAGAYTVQTSLSRQGFAQLGITAQTSDADLKLTSLSTRGFVQSHIAHQFVLQGKGFQKVLITGLALTSGMNPALTLLSAENVPIMHNDDWSDGWQDFSTLNLHAQDAAILAYLHAGTYTVELIAAQQGIGLINIELLQ